MSWQLLLINDMAGYGKVALSAMLPILSYMKYGVFTLPTAIVSNTLDYGQFETLDTTEYIRRTLEVWKNLGFAFDAIATGFIVSEEQTRIVLEFCREQAKRNIPVFTDPILGDDGTLYNGINENIVGYMRELVGVADCIVPNYTEAAYLTGANRKFGSISQSEIRKIIDELRELGSKSVVITSAVVENQSCVIGFDADERRYFRLDYEEIPVRFPGTGDIFSALLMGNVLNGKNLEESAAKAMSAVSRLIRLNQHNTDRYKGIPIENYLEVIDDEPAS